jgi:hypothetical protein
VAQATNDVLDTLCEGFFVFKSGTKGSLQEGVPLAFAGTSSSEVKHPSKFSISATLSFIKARN